MTLGRVLTLWVRFVSSVTHFEIYASEPAKLAGFYRALFGWQLEKAPGIDYLRIQTEPSHTKAFNGGLPTGRFPSRVGALRQCRVLDESSETSGRSGAAPENGVAENRLLYAVVQGPEGNIFAVWQPDSTAFPPPEPE